MTSAAKKLLDEALALPEDDRRRLAEALMETVAYEPSEELEVAWRDEVLRRVDDIQRGDIEPEPWSDVKKRIRQELDR